LLAVSWFSISLQWNGDTVSSDEVKPTCHRGSDFFKHGVRASAVLVTVDLDAKVQAVLVVQKMHYRSKQPSGTNYPQTFYSVTAILASSSVK